MAYLIFSLSLLVVYAGLAILLHIQFGTLGIPNFGVVGFWGFGMYAMGVFVVQYDFSFVDALVVTEIGRDGTMEGPDTDGLATLLAHTGIEVVASGGVGALSHIGDLASLTAAGRRLAGVIVGRALYEGAFGLADAIKTAQEKGFQVNVNATIFDGYDVVELADYLDFATGLGVNISISPGFAYERAPDQEHFLNRQRTKTYFRKLFDIQRERGSKWSLSHSPLYLDFLAGNQEMQCTPWGMPTRNVFGWQKPCYLLGEGYAATYAELMETTEWDKYGTGNYEKCADCMAHCGYEPTAANIAFSNPLKMLKLALTGLRTDGPMAREIDLSKARPGEEHHERIVSEEMSRLSKIAAE